MMSLIVLLSSIGLMAYQTSVQRGREAVLKEDLYRMRDAIDQFYVDKGKYPVDLTELVSGGYLRAVPVGPDDQVDRHLADDSRRARSEQPLRRHRHLQRQVRAPKDWRSTARSTPTGKRGSAARSRPS